MLSAVLCCATEPKGSFGVTLRTEVLGAVPALQGREMPSFPQSLFCPSAICKCGSWRAEGFAGDALCGTSGQ